MNKRKIAVIGGTGFVGLNLCLYLKKKNYDVYAIDSMMKKNGLNEQIAKLENNSITIIKSDIVNSDEIEEILLKIKPDVIVNLAAQVSFKKSVEDPFLDFQINLLGTLNILEIIRKRLRNSKFIYASTNQVYGELAHHKTIEKDTRFDFVDLELGISENEKLDFLSPYGCSKGAADQYVLDYARVYGLDTCVLRLGGIYGVNQYAIEDHGWVSYISKMVLDNKSFNRFGHGKQVRDILYVSDICEAFYLAIINDLSYKERLYNIGGGKDNSISVLELLTKLEKITGNKERSIINPMRQADKLVSYLDISRAKTNLNWEPKISFEKGLIKLVNWLKTVKF